MEKTTIASIGELVSKEWTIGLRKKDAELKSDALVTLANMITALVNNDEDKVVETMPHIIRMVCKLPTMYLTASLSDSVHAALALASKEFPKYALHTKSPDCSKATKDSLGCHGTGEFGCRSCADYAFPKDYGDMDDPIVEEEVE